ncbi:flagellar export chaperone FliS [Stieleria varia]|uniref:Flagellar protein FliS n=1 Tax=Stieleria varia TaxID=2528005 RepID=A0A5C6AQ37_9BACT|nr:flagellar protein FliS [Stieleria varia]TWU02153.1 hypothetical protein Pla52n_32020 [Stieleria varia]
MSQLGIYRKQSLSGGWTRIEMLVQIYDRAIASLDICCDALANGDNSLFSRHLIISQKAIVALHAGLKPEEDEVAYNVARLLHFVVVSIGEGRFADASRILKQLRSGFAAIIEEANQLEREGKIPAMASHDSYQSTA